MKFTSLELTTLEYWFYCIPEREKNDIDLMEKIIKMKEQEEND